MKYKKGDIVTIRKDLKIIRYNGCCCTSTMLPLAGKQAIIRKAWESTTCVSARYIITIDGRQNEYSWSDDMFVTYDVKPKLIKLITTLAYIIDNYDNVTGSGKHTLLWYESALEINLVRLKVYEELGECSESVISLIDNTWNSTKEFHTNYLVN